MADAWEGRSVNPSFSQQVIVDKRFHRRELREEERKPRSRVKLGLDPKDKTQKIMREEYMPDGPEYEVVVNRQGASIRLLAHELAQYGFDKSPRMLEMDTGVTIPDDAELINVSLDSVSMPATK
jgi:hypothetical protein